MNLKLTESMMSLISLIKNRNNGKQKLLTWNNKIEIIFLLFLN